MSKIDDLKEKHRILKENLQEGRHMGPLAVEDMEEHVCLNCHTTYRGYFCPRCGQSAGTKRLTLREGLDNLMTGVLKFNRGMSHTLVELIYRPGYLAYDYIKGYRKEYYPPITLLLILVAVPLLFSTFLPPSTSMAQVSVGMIEDIFRHAKVTWFPFDAIYAFLSIGSVRVLLDAVLLLPALWLSFHWTKVGKQTNWAETFYLNVFISCNTLLLSLLFLPFELISFKCTGFTLHHLLFGGEPTTIGSLTTQDYLSEDLSMLIFIWITHSFYKIGWINSILRSFLYYILVVATLLLTIILLLLCFAFAHKMCMF